MDHPPMMSRCASKWWKPPEVPCEGSPLESFPQKYGPQNEQIMIQYQPMDPMVSKEYWIFGYTLGGWDQHPDPRGHSPLMRNVLLWQSWTPHVQTFKENGLWLSWFHWFHSKSQEKIRVSGVLAPTRVLLTPSPLGRRSWQPNPCWSRAPWPARSMGFMDSLEHPLGDSAFQTVYVEEGWVCYCHARLPKGVCVYI